VPKIRQSTTQINFKNSIALNRVYIPAGGGGGGPTLQTYAIATRGTGIAVDNSDNVYITNDGASTVTKVNSSGVVQWVYQYLFNSVTATLYSLVTDGTNLWGAWVESGGGYTGVMQINTSTGAPIWQQSTLNLTTSGTLVYNANMAGTGLKRLHVINADGNPNPIISTFGTDGTFYNNSQLGNDGVGNTSIAVDSTGAVWALGTDTATTGHLYKLTYNTSSVPTISRQITASVGSSKFLGNLAVEPITNNVFFTTQSSNTFTGIYGVNSGLTASVTAPTVGPGGSIFSSPIKCLTFDSTGNLYFAANGKLIKYNTSKTPVWSISNTGYSSFQGSLASTAAGNIMWGSGASTHSRKEDATTPYTGTYTLNSTSYTQSTFTPTSYTPGTISFTQSTNSIFASLVAWSSFSGTMTTSSKTTPTVVLTS